MSLLAAVVDAFPARADVATYALLSIFSFAAERLDAPLAAFTLRCGNMYPSCPSVRASSRSEQHASAHEGLLHRTVRYAPDAYKESVPQFTHLFPRPVPPRSIVDFV
jgi:hypothetical protein